MTLLQRQDVAPLMTADLVDGQLAVAIWSKVAFSCAMNSICAVAATEGIR